MLEAAALRNFDLDLHIRRALPILPHIGPALAGVQAARALRHTGCIDVGSTAREVVHHKKVVVRTERCHAAFLHAVDLHGVGLRGAGRHESLRDRCVAVHSRLFDRVDMLNTAGLADVGCGLVHRRTDYVDAGYIDHTDIQMSRERADHRTGLAKLRHHMRIDCAVDIARVAVPAHHGLGHHMKQ